MFHGFPIDFCKNETQYLFWIFLKYLINQLIVVIKNNAIFTNRILIERIISKLVFQQVFVESELHFEGGTPWNPIEELENQS